MTLGRPAITSDPIERRITRRVSSMALSISGSGEEGRTSTAKVGDTAQSPNSNLSRQVSNDGLANISDTDNDKDYYSSSSGRTSPVRCVSEFDKAVSSFRTCDSPKNNDQLMPSSSLARNPSFLKVHARALRLEADLQPMRLILSRIMAHPTLNRKGIFNSPVDPVALGLSDYYDVIEKPMDLGMVKVKLHAIVYLSRRQVADDIRLVFENAMKYNPPHNAVHVAAKDLLAFFEDQIQAFAPDLSLAKGDNIASSQVTLPSTRSIESVAPALPTIHESVHSQATRNSASGELLEPVHQPRKRAKRGSKVNPGHACNRCLGRSCLICHQGCLPLESTLLICNGAHCAGTRIRKGAVYFVSPDGGRHFCQRCHTGLPAVLPHIGHDEQVRYKRDLLKRKNDEEIVEEWLNCSQCDGAVHRMCALVDEFVHGEEGYRCPDCVMECDSAPVEDVSPQRCGPVSDESDLYTFVSGSEVPVKLTEVTGTMESSLFSAEALPETDVSSFIQRRVRDRMVCETYPHAERTVLVRIISDCRRCFKIPEVVRKHFRMATDDNDPSASIAPPLATNYQSKAIALFQKIDGVDVCIFCMYVHEYDGDDHFDEADGASKSKQKKRVYIAYLDSVEHFRPRSCRTSVYHEMLVAYLATARKRGYEVAHIWSCPPSRGNCFVFWNHPSSQRTPNPERLGSWYHAALSRAVECGVVTDIQSLYETSFQHLLEPDHAASPRKSFVPCPPLLDGDFWIEEAVRLHSINMARHLRAKVEEIETPLALPSNGCTTERCPARQVASLLRDKVISHPSALAFRRPVNAVAMKLVDYHKIIANPMDLGTVYTRCVLGEYVCLSDLVADVELVFSNAKTYNPEGHIVYAQADEVRGMFFSQLNQLVRPWIGISDEHQVSWEAVANISMSLDLVFGLPTECDESLEPTHSTRLQFDESLIEPVAQSGINKENLSTEQSSVAKSDPVDLVSGGPEAVQQRMIGDDSWLLDKSPAATKGAGASKRGIVRRRRSLDGDVEDEPPSKRRRQSWLGIEVGTSVRRMRTSFFSCSLVAKSQQTDEDHRVMELYESYTSDLNCAERKIKTCSSTIADVRHSLLEFSQFRNLEFDTLRHAKYSTAVLLHHFHNEGAPGVVPVCTDCGQDIKEVRWHKLCKPIDLRRRKNPPVAPSRNSEELCSECYSTKHKQDNQFIPLQVTVTSQSPLNSTAHPSAAE